MSEAQSDSPRLPDPHEAAFRRQVEADWPATLAAYDRLPLAHGGKVIEIDIARSLYPPYAASPEGARRLSPVTGRVAAAVYRKRLDAAMDAARPGQRFVWFAGGPASGKSTRAQLHARDPEVAVVVDGIFGGEFYHHRNRLLKALKRGLQVEFHYVFRPVFEAMPWMVKRAARIGRELPPDAMARLHWESQQNVARLLAELPSVKVCLIDTSNAGGGAIEMLAHALPERIRYASAPDPAALAGGQAGRDSEDPNPPEPRLLTASSPVADRAYAVEREVRRRFALGALIAVP